MRLYKKFLAAFLCGIMLLAGCGGDKDDGFVTVTDAEGNTVTDAEGNPVTSKAPSAGDIFTTVPEESPYPLDLKVGFVYAGEVGSDSLVAFFENARFEVERTLGVKTGYIQGVLLQQFDDAVEKLVENGYDIIVAASNHYNAACLMASKKHTNTYFISFGGSDQSINLCSIQPLLYQPANVCGLVAAYNTVTNKIGMVVDNNLYNAYAVADAFALGVRELPNAQIELGINWALSNFYSDTRMAVDDLVNNGYDVIFIYQSDSYGIRRCEELGVKVIGMAYNIPEIAPNNYLTGMYMNFNTFIIDKVRNIQYGSINKFGNLARRGLSQGTTGMVRLNEEICKTGTKTLADTLLQYVSEEKSPVFGGEIRDTNDNIRVKKGASLSPGELFSIRWLVSNITREQNLSQPLIEDDLYFSDLKLWE